MSLDLPDPLPFGILFLKKIVLREADEKGKEGST
jgi:hypothetical protein